MDPREQVREMLLAQFRNMNASEGHVLPQRWIALELVPRLTPPQKDALEDAVNGLIAEGLIDERLALTQAGVAAIY